MEKSKFFHYRVPQASTRRVDYPQKIHIVIKIADDPQIRQNVLYLLAVKKTGTTGDCVRDVTREKRLFKCSHHRICTNQHPEVVKFNVFLKPNSLDFARDEICLVAFVLWIEKLYGLAATVA